MSYTICHLRLIDIDLRNFSASSVLYCNQCSLVSTAQQSEYGTRRRLKLFTTNPKSIGVRAGDCWRIDNIEAVYGIVQINWNVSYEIRFKQTIHRRFLNIG